MSLTVKIALSPLLVAQALLTRRRMPRLAEPAGPRQGVVGAPGATPLRLLMAGDSSAAGVGVSKQSQALAEPLARQLARACAARVQWQLLAESGLTTAQTFRLLQREAPPQADIAVVVSGVNDVMGQVPSHRAVRSREAIANWLRNAHGVWHVVFAPLPPVHGFVGLPQPLRWVAGADALRHNAALQDWAGTRGDVSCVDMQMPQDAALMAADGFHPAEAAYRYCATAIAQHIATQVWPQLQMESAP
jgi:lysophospholipase L1-like esterase